MTRFVALVVLVVFAAAACSSGAATPEALVTGRRIYGDVCSACHGSAGEGGVGPALAAVTATWPSCADQVAWISLGSAGWRAEFGDTYGATDKPVLGGMPGHADRFTPDEIASVAAFERITYGGADEAQTLTECGLPTG